MITSHKEAQQYAMQLVKQFVVRHAKTIEKRKKYGDIILHIPLDTLRGEYLKHVSYDITSKTKYFNIEVINQILNR